MKKATVIGAGIFGSVLSMRLSDNGYRVDLLEKGSEAMLGASEKNHCRYHYGFHYPRCPETVAQIKWAGNHLTQYLGLFLDYLPHYYGIADSGSKISYQDFSKFAETVGHFMPCSNEAIKSVEGGGLADEPVWNLSELRQAVTRRLQSDPNINVFLDHEVKDEIPKGIVFDCTYRGDGVPDVKKQECFMLEYEGLPLNGSATIMDGPFCSLMSSGKNRHRLWHVTESVQGTPGSMVDESLRFFPFLKRSSRSKFKLVRTIPVQKVFVPTGGDGKPTRIVELEDRIAIIGGKMQTALMFADKAIAML
jgi:hypothetical protein